MKEYEFGGKIFLLKYEGSKYPCENCSFNTNSICDTASKFCGSGGYFVEKSNESKTDANRMLLPTDAKERKNIPITTGVLDYFPLAIAEVAKLSKAGNDQHNPGEDLHWDRSKSKDHADCISRHLIDRGKLDTDNQRHSAKLAWRALALLQIELENEQKNDK